MKTSNLPYCIEIPNDWHEVPNRYLFEYHSTTVGGGWKDYQLLSLTTSGVKEKDINVGGGKVPDSYDNYQTVEPGDMVFCLFDLDVSAVFSGLSHHCGMITSAYDVVRPNKNILFQGYADYWFQYVFSNRYYKMYSKNVRYTITSEMFKAIRTPIPPMSIQRKIAEFLNKKTSEIDSLIEVENKQIEKLKEYKQAVITEAVTNGLDKSAQMKDSGVEWIGQIPNHWKLIQNRFLFEYHSKKVGTSWKDYQLLSLTTSGVKEKDIKSSGGKVPDTYDNYQTVEPGDMVFCLFDLDVSAVFSGLSHHYGMITSAYDVVRPNNSILYQGYADYWFQYVFSNRYYKSYSKNIRYTITSEVFRSISTPIPPMEEQTKIGRFLDKKCADIDRLITLKQQKIDKLNEYKKTIIYEYVTGKKEVV